MLSDDEWAHVAGEIMHRTGLAPRGEEDDAVHPGEITGYSVALAGDMTSAGEPVWYGGGKLAADLTLPKLRRRWNDAPDGSAARNARLTPAERAAIWDHAARTATNATAQVRQLARSSRGSSPAPAQQGGPNSAPANWS